MWLFTIYGMYSATQSIDPDVMQVRARNENHLKNLTEKFKILEKYSEISLDMGTD
ncbi:hypothetical protein ACFL27_20100 [candidate division CSSED10-310 bacterium]|uniref:Uncharacterized protein n=1 Tax=candidate division CSSED10-310 bacterium TaxID=2855610 RepID=A0ABV6Z226_UNCC1